MASNRKLHPDAELIARLGGATKLARRLGFPEGGAQRVNNWKLRGIPPAVKLAYMDIFLPKRVIAMPTHSVSWSGNAFTWLYSPQAWEATPTEEQGA